MTPAKAVAKARRELKKLHNKDFAYLSNEDFRVGKLRRFIDLHVNEKGNTSVSYHHENDWIKDELNAILTWDRTQLNRAEA